MNNLQEKIKVVKLDVSNNCDNYEENEKIIIYVLNTCGILCNNLKELNGIIIPRETLLNDSIYDKVKKDIPKLKSVLSSTVYTSMQKNADKHQKWPLINLIRQILRKYNYQFLPKRVCDGYTKDGIKKYKRFFEVRSESFIMSTL